MPRIARMKVKGEPAVYHVISRTALDGFVLGDVEKDHLVNIIRHLSAIYFAEVLGFCAMGNHLHLLVRMHPGDAFSDEDIKKRFKLYYGDDQRPIRGVGMPGPCPGSPIRDRKERCTGSTSRGL